MTIIVLAYIFLVPFRPGTGLGNNRATAFRVWEPKFLGNISFAKVIHRRNWNASPPCTATSNVRASLM